MADLEYLEMHMMNSCNLNCKGCSHFSNISTDDDLESISEFEKNMRQLAKIQPVIYKIRLLGGEPLLNQDIEVRMSIVRKYYPYSDIHMVTNGLLIPVIPLSVIETIKKENICVDISLYPPTRKAFDKIKGRLEEFAITYETTEPIEQFCKRMSLSGDSDIVEAFNECNSKQCHFYHHGKLSACPAPYLISHFSKYFNEEITVSENDEISIYEPGLDSDRLVQFLNSPMDMCRFCNKIVTFDWQCGGEAKMSDWIVDL